MRYVFGVEKFISLRNLLVREIIMFRLCWLHGAAISAAGRLGGAFENYTYNAILQSEENEKIL